VSNTEVYDVASFSVGDEDRVDVSLNVEKRERGLPDFVFVTIERVEYEDIVVETLTISGAEALHSALGEAIKVGKKAVTEHLESEE